MNKNKEPKKTFPNTGAPKSGQKIGSARDATNKPGEVEIIQPKRGTWQTYDATDGLPGGVWCLLQDRKGFLWLGTEVGLCRYDGAEFITYTSADGLAHDYVYAICESHEGLLWFGTRGGGVSCFDGQNFVNYTTAQGLADDHVSAICEDSQSRMWFGTDGGVSCFDGQDFSNYTTKDGLCHNQVQAICEDREGGLWFGTGWWNKPGRGVSCFDGESFITYSTENGLPYDSVTAICEDRQGLLWFATCGGGVSCLNGQEFTNYTTDDGLPAIYVLTICEDRQGRLWFGAYGGVFCFDGQNFITYTTEDGLPDNRVVDIIQDREDCLWFANSFSGLTCFDTETIRLITEKPVSETLIQDRDGGLWFGYEKELCYLKEGQLQRKVFASNAIIYSILEDSSGGIWVGLFEEGLYYYDSPNAVWSVAGKHFAERDGLLGNEGVVSLLEGMGGTIWAGTEGTPGYLCRAVYSEPVTDSTAVKREVNAFEAIPTPYNTIYRLFEDNRGGIYIGGRVWAGEEAHVGLSCYDSNKPDHFYGYAIEDGLLGDGIMSILEDDSGDLWIGTSQGLYCYDGKQFVLYGKEQGLACLTHQWSTKDVNGQLWFGTLGGGLYRYDGRHFQTLTTRDGLPSNSVTGLVAQPDGSMIIGTYRGIVHYHPTATLPPSVEIREVVADKVYRNPIELELTTTETRLLTVSYGCLNFATRQMRYSYILDGHDTEWQDTWERQVRYENLPVGEYTLKVIAINRDLVTSECPAILKLKIVPDPRDMMLKELQSDLSIKNQQMTFLQREMGSKYQFENIIGKSKEIEWVRSMMDRAIDSGLNVLIAGETGTGKELVAKGIHYNSSRKDKLMIPFNCGAVSKELVNSELFGHKRGSFTGAIEDKMGLFEVANGSALALDEIGEMPMDVQVNLLRVLQEGEVSRIGEHEIRKVDVRIIAVTNRDLAKEIEVGRFREDLYYRLDEFNIYVPPLRERREDIPLLAEHFYQEAYQEQGKELKGFSPEMMNMLKSYSWPGNVRELKNEIFRAYALAEEGSYIQAYHLSPKIIQNESLTQEIISRQSGMSEAVELFKRRLIQDALEKSGGNHTKAAEILKMHRPSLIRIMRNLDIK